jgi:hypothetical protein
VQSCIGSVDRRADVYGRRRGWYNVQFCKMKVPRPATAQSIFWAVVLSAALLKLILALSTVGTNDVLFFQAYAAKVQSEGAVALYRDDIVLLDSAGLPRHPEVFAHPPLIIHLLQFLSWAQALTGLSFPFLFRLLSILADIGSAVLLRRLLSASSGVEQSFLPACLFAGAPLLIFLSGFHGNTDPIMVFFLLLCVWLLSERRIPWVAGVAFGIGCNVKVWPLILVPAIVLSIPGFRDRLLFSVSALLTFLLGALPVAAENPSLVAGKVFGYSSLIDHWGLSRILPLIGLPSLLVLYDQFGRPLLLLAGIGAGIWLSWKSRAGIPLRIGLVTSLFLVFTPGFGIQYLSWLLPWVAFLGSETLLIYLICTGLFMFHVYSFWSNGLPWNIADSTIVGDWKGFLVWHELLCWASTVFCFILFLRKCAALEVLKSAPNASPQPVSQPADLQVRKRPKRQLVQAAKGRR